MLGQLVAGNADRVNGHPNHAHGCHCHRSPARRQRGFGVELLDESNFLGTKEIGRGQRELDQYHDGPDFHVLHEGDIMAFFLKNPDCHHGGGTADRRKIAT